MVLLDEYKTRFQNARESAQEIIMSIDVASIKEELKKLMIWLLPLIFGMIPIKVKKFLPNSPLSKAGLQNVRNSKEKRMIAKQ